MGFEPTNGGFADLSLGPLGYRAELPSIAILPVAALRNITADRSISRVQSITGAYCQGEFTSRLEELRVAMRMSVAVGFSKTISVPRAIKLL